MCASCSEETGSPHTVNITATSPKITAHHTKLKLLYASSHPRQTQMNELSLLSAFQNIQSLSDPLFHINSNVSNKQYFQTDCNSLLNSSSLW